LSQTPAKGLQRGKARGEKVRNGFGKKGARRKGDLQSKRWGKTVTNLGHRSSVKKGKNTSVSKKEKGDGNVRTLAKKHLVVREEAS